VLVTAADAFVLLLVEQWGVRQLEAVFGIFIAIMAGSFGVMYNNADIPQSQVLEGQPCVFLESCTSRTLIPSPPCPAQPWQDSEGQGFGLILHYDL